MLALSRQVGETVVITVPPSAVPQEVRIVVASADRQKARLAFEADPLVIVDRLEVHERRKAGAR
jgi:sRNA-binding carbon storage regulator CsrA